MALALGPYSDHIEDAASTLYQEKNEKYKMFSRRKKKFKQKDGSI